MTLSSAAMPDNLRLIGGEMLVWSDNEPNQDRVAAGGSALSEVLLELARPGGRALVAGLHDPALISLLQAEQMHVTCLLRAYPDAEAVANTHPSVLVLCGNLTKIDAQDPYDLVIAGGGLDRLMSADGPQLSWSEMAGLLTGVIRPGGTLVLTQENLLGVHRLVALSPWYGERTDADWNPVGETDQTRPVSVADLERKLSDLGLTMSERLLAFPTPQQPSVLLPTALCHDEQLTPYLQIVVSAAFGGAFAGKKVLSDPRPLAVSVLRAGAGEALAPAWVAVASKGTTVQVRSRAIVTDARHEPWPVCYELVRGPEGWNRGLLGTRTPVRRDDLIRDPQALDGPLPTGRLLEDHLIDLCMNRDLPELRTVLGQFADWVAAPADDDGMLSGAELCVLPSELVMTGDSFARWDPSWSSELRVPVDVALARALREFAVMLLTSGYAHPWPALGTADELAIVLGGMAGRNWDNGKVLPAAVALQVQLSAAERGLDAEQQAQLSTELMAVGQGTAPLGLESYRELQTALARLREEVAHEKAMNAWNEQMLLSREFALRRAERQVEFLSGTFTARLGKLLFLLARRTLRLVRRIGRRLSKSADQ